MSGQTVYRDQLVGFPGQRVGIGHHADSYVNDLGAVRQIDDLQIAVVAAFAYSYTVNGVLVAYTSGAAPTAQSIRDGLLNAYRAIQQLEDVASVNPSGLDVRTTAGQQGVPFTIANLSANLTLNPVVPNVAPQPIGFGLAVVMNPAPGSADDSATLPSGAGQKLAGIAERIHSNVDPTDAGVGNGQISPGQSMTVGKRGTWLVAVESAVAKGDPVFFRHTAGAGGTVLGAWRNDADTATADAVLQAQFETTTTGAGLAELSINLP